MNSLKYTSERDRAFGVAGMATAVCMGGHARHCTGATLDAPHGAEITFAPAFFYRVQASPLISARKLWEEAVKDYAVSQNMVLANLMCRSMVENSSLPTPALLNAARRELRDMSREECELTDEEFSSMFDREISLLRRVFAVGEFADMCRRCASELISRRTIDSDDFIDIFSPLLSRL